MITRGEYSNHKETFGVIMNHTNNYIEIILVSAGTVASAYKKGTEGSFMFLSNTAKVLYEHIHTALLGWKNKSATAIPFELGTSLYNEVTKANVKYAIERFNGQICGIDAEGKEISLKLRYVPDGEKLIPNNIPYIKLTDVMTIQEGVEETDLDSVPVRSVKEIAMEKEDVSWLKGKKYYIINDDAQAEQIFSMLDTYNGVIAYDTETTGLRINCFGKINSSYAKQLREYNTEHPDNTIRADRLVGIIFCVEKDVSYYFPCFNRKFKNLYDNDTETRRKVIEMIKARYTIGEFASKQSDMADYIRNTPAEQWGSDVILMERVRNILSTKHIVAHNGSFEWKVGWQYEIDTNLKDDTMIMHQIMYKFRSTTSNRGEPSNLKYLAKHEFGVDQWELTDFFPDYSEAIGEVRTKSSARGKKKHSKIDFSYMDYDGTRVYAPTDGDITFQLYLKYKSDMLTNHKDQEYLYNVEVVVACAIAYMEFYGHRIEEHKIETVRDDTTIQKRCIESEIRQMISYSSAREFELYTKIKELEKGLSDIRDENEKARVKKEMLQLSDEMEQVISEDTEHSLNLASPAQVAELFYDKMEIPFSGDKKSVAKREIKALLKEKNEDDSLKYPIVDLYSKYKQLDTLLTKFFDNLPYYQYPGGIIFSSYGQISTATGRMSCQKPNAQQYPKSVTAIVGPRPGYVMMDADYSQIEYRVLVALAGEDNLASLFSDPDSDYHTLMASLMFSVPYASVTTKMRGDAKSFNFGIPYGMGIGSLAILLTGINNATTRAEAAEKYELYFKNQPKTRKFFNIVKEMAQINKYTKTFWNRYRYYSFTNPDGSENNARKAAALRQAGNAIIQGCVAAGTKIQTKEFGIVNIEDVVDRHLLVWNGQAWTNGDILYSGLKQKCIVTFGNGQQFICSPTHKFLVRSPRGKQQFVECQDLITSDFSTTPHRVVTSNLKDFNKPNAQDGCLTVKSVEITDEYIDMYDVCNTDEGYYVADGIVTHNTAADLFKISVARNFIYIRENNLLGDLLIVNMIHDEQLFEVNVQKLNMIRVLADIGKNMQFKVQGFPPLFIGAGIGPVWAKAKGKMAEIHPNLLSKLTEEAQSVPLFKSKEEVEAFNQDTDIKKVLDYFADRVLKFRIQHVKEYLMNPENRGKDLHPAIGNLLNLQFTYGHDKDKEGLSDTDFTMLCLKLFIEHEGLEGLESQMFIGDTGNNNQTQENEDDIEYDDDEDEEAFDITEEEKEFMLVDESSKLYGASIHDLIKTFGYFVSINKKVCGIDLMPLSFKKKDALVQYLDKHACNSTEEDAMEVVFLKEGNVLNNTGICVRGVKPREIEAILKA